MTTVCFRMNGSDFKYRNGIPDFKYRNAILNGFGSYGSRAMWQAHFAYLEVVVVGEGVRRQRPSLLKLG
jgi:hypothetical protein